MANPEDIKRAMDGVTVWNDWAEDKKKKGEAPVADFSGHRFGTISFAGFNFPGIVQFSEAVFTETTQAPHLAIGRDLLGRPEPAAHPSHRA